MKQAAETAEEVSSPIITAAHITSVLAKGVEEHLKETTDLDEDCRFILEVVKSNSGMKIGDLFKRYESVGGKQSYKTFSRKMQTLAYGGFVSLKKIGGAGGNSTIVSHQQIKKLSEF